MAEYIAERKSSPNLQCKESGKCGEAKMRSNLYIADSKTMTEGKKTKVAQERKEAGHRQTFAFATSTKCP